MASVSNEVDGIRRQMAQIRRELHEDVQGVVAGAEAVADWRRYIRLYPWAAVGAAACLGYLIAPRRHRQTPPITVQVTPAAAAAPVQATAREGKAESAVTVKKEKRAGLAGTLFGLLAPMAWKAAQNYAMSFAEQWIAQQAAAGQNPLAFLQGIPGMPGMAPGPAQPPPGYPPGPGQPGAPGARPGPGPRRP